MDGGWKLVSLDPPPAPPRAPLFLGVKRKQINDLLCIREMVIKKGTEDLTFSEHLLWARSSAD